MGSAANATRSIVATTAMLVIATACNGAIGGAARDDAGLPGSDGGSPTTDGGGAWMPGEEPACDGICVGESELTRLSRTEYASSVRQILGDSMPVDIEQLPRDHQEGLFASNEGVDISERDIDMYASVADEVARQAASEVARLAPCGAGETDRACALSFVDGFLERVYRRPVDASERDAYAGLVDWALDGGDLAEAIETVVGAALQSPLFLYRVERATDEPTLLDGYELATRLSYFLWETTPTDPLLASAAAGELDTPEGVMAKATEMLEDPRASTAIRLFHRQWLGSADVELIRRDDPAFTSEVARDLRRETDRFAVNVIREGGGTLEELLSAPHTFINPRLAGYYGVAPPALEGFARASLPGRAGILTHGSVMATHSAEGFTSPVYRGQFIRIRIMCTELGPRPADVADRIDDIATGIGVELTDRERLEALTSPPDCAYCHHLMNPIGYGFAKFDHAGRYREVDSSGKPIDAAATVSGYGAYASDVDGAFVGAVELAQRLGGSDTVAQCVTKQWARYALGRLEAPGDAGSLETAYRAFRDSGYDIRVLMVALTGTDAFRYRTAAP